MTLTMSCRSIELFKLVHFRRRVALIVPQFLHAVTFAIVQSIRNPSIIEIVPSPCQITGLTRRIVSAVQIVFTDTQRLPLLIARFYIAEVGSALAIVHLRS